MGGQGGSGDCHGFVQPYPAIEVSRPDSVVDVDPELTRSSDDGEQLTVAFVREPVSAPQFADVRHATFQPWKSWPTGGALSPTYLTHTTGAPVIGIRLGPSTDDHFGAVIGYPQGTYYSFAVNASADDSASFTWVVAGAPQFLSPATPDLQCIGLLNPSNELYATIIDANPSPGGPSTTNYKLACSTSGVVGDSTRYGDGWLVAHSNGTGAPKSGCWTPSDAGLPTRIDMSWFTTSGPVAFMGGLEVSLPIVTLREVPHPAGSYIIWRELGTSETTPIRWARFDAMASSFVGPGDLSSPGENPVAMTATAFGSRLAVAYSNQPPGKAPSIVIKVLDESGSTVAETAFASQFKGKLTMISSPSAQSLVVGFSGGSGAPAINLVRLDCVP